jgi:hypothetical protein
MTKKGRPTFEATEEQRKQVETLSGYGLTQEQIATFLDVSVPTLKKHFKPQLKRGKVAAVAVACQALFSNIKKGKEASIFFYLKTQAHWREKAEVEHTQAEPAKIIIEAQQPPDEPKK